MTTIPRGDTGVGLCACLANQQPAFISRDSVCHYLQKFNNGGRRSESVCVKQNIPLVSECRDE